MITYTTDSIFRSSAMCLVNPVNTVGVMGAGLAKQFADRFPAMYERYKDVCKQRRLTIGGFFSFKRGDRIIYCFPTKDHWRDESRVGYIDMGLITFVNNYAIVGITSVSFPKLGCGLGGLDFEIDVKPLMEKRLGALDIPVYIHI